MCSFYQHLHWCKRWLAKASVANDPRNFSVLEILQPVPALIGIPHVISAIPCVRHRVTYFLNFRKPIFYMLLQSRLPTRNLLNEHSPASCSAIGISAITRIKFWMIVKKHYDMGQQSNIWKGPSSVFLMSNDAQLTRLALWHGSRRLIIWSFVTKRNNSHWLSCEKSSHPLSSYGAPFR